MTPEDRVSHTMELQEDVASKVQTIKKKIEFEKELLPQGKSINFCCLKSVIFGWVSVCENPEMTFPIKKRIKTELFIDETASIWIGETWIIVGTNEWKQPAELADWRS